MFAKLEDSYNTGEAPASPVRIGAETLKDLIALSVAILLAFSLAYILGHSILSGNLEGNDSPLHVGYARWLNGYFPQIPHWYPLQGGGTSLLHGYPILPHLLVVVVHRVTGLSILQAFRAISLVSFPLSALGVYAFCRIVLRTRTAGLVAILFYLISPINWTWMYNWGFFAQQVAIIFVPLSLIAFERTWRATRLRPQTGHRRLWFVLLTILVVVASLSHLLVGFAAVLGMAIYLAFSSLLAPSGKRRAIMRSGIKVFTWLGIAVGLLAAAYLVPFYQYGRIANRDGSNTPGSVQVHELSVSHFFGLDEIDQKEVLTRMQFPLVVSISAGVGIAISLFAGKRRTPAAMKALAFGGSAILVTIFALVPDLPILVVELWPMMFTFVNFRTMLILAMVLIPALAAYGVVATAHLLVFPEVLFRGRTTQIAGRSMLARALRGGFSFVLSLGIAGAGTYFFGAQMASSTDIIRYGPDKFEPGDIWDILPGEETMGLGEQLPISNWPSAVPDDSDRLIQVSQAFASLIDEGRHVRFDISPFKGRLLMDLVTFTDASQIAAYTYTMSLVHVMWGYQQSVFYMAAEPGIEYGNLDSLSNVADWFGTEYVIADGERDPTSLYEEAGWELTYADELTQLWRNPKAPGLAESFARPVILVVSKPESDIYNRLFRIANDGMLPFKDAIIVEGDSRIDQYKLEDLQYFDALFLHGYDYRNSKQAWQILANYVQGGGNLFIDTGWEFWVPEWEFEEAPSVLPVDRLVWADYGKAASYAIGSTNIAGAVDISAFNPLIWEGQPWTLSGADNSDVRNWAQVVLSAADRPLIAAGQYGEGKVVWSGMNLMAHADYGGRNDEELQLLRNLLDWLTQDASLNESADVVVNRSNPDSVTFDIQAVPGQTTWLYWREAVYPNWHAYILDGDGREEIPIFRAGPGFMLMPVKSNSELASVELIWELPWEEKLAVFLSAAGLLFIAAHAVDGLILGGNGLTWFKIAILTKIPRPFLGHGDGEAWARRKRKELEREETAQGPKTYEPSEAVAWFREETLKSADGTGADHLGNTSMEVAGLTEPDEAELLDSWMKKTGHQDDEWARKLFDDKEKSGEP